MLFKAFVVQIVTGTIFLLAPITIYLLMYVLQIPDSSYITTKCVHFGISYGLFEAISMTYFITPYRNAVLSIFKTDRKKKTLLIAAVSKSSHS